MGRLLSWVVFFVFFFSFFFLYSLLCITSKIIEEKKSVVN